jgi:hypothetical protein
VNPEPEHVRPCRELGNGGGVEALATLRSWWTDYAARDL